ncbi:MAG: hypothetical protein ACKOQ0_01785 [Solirubrobacterales bacterium]
MARTLRAAVAAALLGALAWLMAGRSVVNYDTLYSLAWGRELARGRTPDFDLPFSPTPHPLSTLYGILLSPLSAAADGAVHALAAIDLTIVLGFFFLGVLIWLVYELGAEWFGPWAGVVAALVMLTSRPLLDFGARAYVDIPYVALVLGAVLIESRRRRAGWPVLALLAVAGLIRPEAWAFSAAYVLWLLLGDRSDARKVAGWIALAALAPLVWVLSDWLLAGSPVHSLTGTQENVRALDRPTGLGDLPLTVPRRIGEILREPVLFAAAGGLAFAWWTLREKAKIAVVVGVVALGAFSVLAIAGLPILGRYLLLPAAIGAIFCGAGVFGWRELEPGDQRRQWWSWFAVVSLVLLAVFLPSRAERISGLREALERQDAIQQDLKALVEQPPGLIGRDCLPVTVPNHRPVPLLSLWLDLPPAAIVNVQERRPRQGTWVTPANPSVSDNYILDRGLGSLVVPAPAGFRPAGGNASWRVSRLCPR